MTTLFGAELNVAFVCKERLMFGWQQITLPMTIAFSSFCCSSTDFKAVPIFLSDYTLKYAKNPPKYAEIAKKKAANIMSQWHISNLNWGPIPVFMLKLFPKLYEKFCFPVYK